MVLLLGAQRIRRVGRAPFAFVMSLLRELEFSITVPSSMAVISLLRACRAHSHSFSTPDLKIIIKSMKM